MSNQIVISSGAKVRSLEGVLTGTAGIVNSVPLGGANGVATLDSLGKVPLSQLPASVVTYLGTWNAATNTPTLTNGVGDVGDLYICNVAGTVNFGAGPITFAVGDWVIYSGTEWQKSSGASGTVTSVAVTESGDALTITGSPITTSGTINIGFAGTGSQYIKGDGTLATFPTTIDQAKRLITEVYNSTGATLSKGTVVYINGGQGNLPTVTKAQANADNTSAQTYGVVQSDITNMNNGFVVVFGSLTDLDTQAYAVGTQLYLSGTTAGDWTSTKPSAPIHLVYVGIVVRSHPTQGVVEIRIQNGYELEELHDVAISSPVNNQGIFYNSSNDLWENKSIATALGYTPANDALVVHLAGTETISGLKNFDAAINLKVGSGAGGTGYIGLGSITNNTLVVYNTTSGTTYSQSLAFPTTSAQTYTFPAINGTVTLLEGTQTFSGAKTFSTFPTTFDAESIFNLGFQIKKITTGVSASAGYMAMYSPVGTANKIAFLDGDSTRVSTLTFDTTGSFSYTFPASTGTLALTNSSITQTFSNNNIFSGTANFTSTLTADTGILLKNAAIFTASGYLGLGGLSNGLRIGFNGGFTSDFILNTGANYVYTFPASSGTLALTSNLSSYLPLTGGTLTGALTGTSATFSSTININNSAVANYDLNIYNTIPRIQLQNPTSGTTTSDGLHIYQSGSDSYILNKEAANLYLGSNNGINLTIASTGAATFSSSVTATSGIFTQSAGQSLQVYQTSATNSTTAIIRQTGAGGNGNQEIGLVVDIQGANDQDRIANFRYYDGTNYNSRLAILRGGNVGIGTSSPQNLLHIKAGSSGLASYDARYKSIIENNGEAYYVVTVPDNSYAGLRILGTSTSGKAGFEYYMTDDNLLIYSNGYQRFMTAGTERMRITSDGWLKTRESTSSTTAVHILRGDTSTDAVTQIINNSASNGSDGMLAVVANRNTTNNTFYAFGYYNSGASAWKLRVADSGNVTNTNNSYGAISDIKLKENIVDASPKLNDLLKVKIKNFNYIGSEEKQLGVIAQELEQIFPSMIEIHNDKDSDGNDLGTTTKSVKYSVFVPMLIKAIQEQQAQIEELKALINK